MSFQQPSDTIQKLIYFLFFAHSLYAHFFYFINNTLYINLLDVLCFPHGVREGWGKDPRPALRNVGRAGVMCGLDSLT